MLYKIGHSMQVSNIQSYDYSGPKAGFKPTWSKKAFCHC